jgi:hypothetical protein
MGEAQTDDADISARIRFDLYISRLNGQMSGGRVRPLQQLLNVCELALFENNGEFWRVLPQSALPLF